MELAEAALIGTWGRWIQQSTTPVKSMSGSEFAERRSITAQSHEWTSVKSTPYRRVTILSGEAEVPADALENLKAFALDEAGNVESNAHHVRRGEYLEKGGISRK